MNTNEIMIILQAFDTAISFVGLIFIVWIFVKVTLL